MFLLNKNKSIGTNETFLGVQNESGLRETWEISCKGCSFLCHWGFSPFMDRRAWGETGNNGRDEKGTGPGKYL